MLAIGHTNTRFVHAVYCLVIRCVKGALIERYSWISCLSYLKGSLEKMCILVLGIIGFDVLKELFYWLVMHLIIIVNVSVLWARYFTL